MIEDDAMGVIAARLRAADPASAATESVDVGARDLARRVADARPRRRRVVWIGIAGGVAMLGLTGGVAVANPALLPWNAPYVGDLNYERSIAVSEGQLHCRIAIGAERDGQAGDGGTEKRFTAAKRFLESVDVDVLDAATDDAADAGNGWAIARRTERTKSDPDERYIISTFAGQIGDEFVARGFLRQGIALQSEYGCEVAE